MSACHLCSTSVLVAAAALRAAQEASRDADTARDQARAALVTATRLFLAAAAVEGAVPPADPLPAPRPESTCTSYGPIRRTLTLNRKRPVVCPALVRLAKQDKARRIARQEQAKREEEERRQEEEQQEQEYDDAATLLDRLFDPNYPNVYPRSPELA
jgi:hypothetical protein